MRLLFIFFAVCTIAILYILLFLPSSVLSIYFRSLASEAELNEITDLTTARQITPLTKHPGQTIRFNTIQLKAPWKELASRQQTQEAVIIRSKQNQILLLTNTDGGRSTVIETFTPNKDDAEDIQKTFEESTKKSDFALYRTIIENSPSEVNFSPLKNLTTEDHVLISSKELFSTILSGNKSSGSFSNGTMHGLQVGNPRVINKILVLLFDRSNEKYSLWLSGFSQPEIDVVLSTITTNDSVSF